MGFKSHFFSLISWRWGELSFGFLVLFWPFTWISVDNNITFLLLALFELYKPPNIFSTYALFHLFVFSLFFLLLFVSIMSPRFVQFSSREMYHNHHSYPCLHCHPHSYIRMVSESLFFLSPPSIYQSCTK